MHKNKDSELSKLSEMKEILKSNLNNARNARHFQFHADEDTAKIRQMGKDVEAYERAIQQRATIEEQARLRQMEAEKLNHKAKTLKEKSPNVE